jgi:hypothetical protein
MMLIPLCKWFYMNPMCFLFFLNNCIHVLKYVVICMLNYGPATPWFILYVWGIFKISLGIFTNTKKGMGESILRTFYQRF